MRMNQLKRTGQIIVLGLVGWLGGTGCVSTKQSTQVQDGEQLVSSIPVIGQREYVTVLPQEYRYRARIDTGATTCSISALDIERFERDGEKWVRFRFPLPSKDPKAPLKKSDVQEYPISRDVNIKRHGAADQIRPAIKLHVTLGSFDGRIEFTLTDRSKYEFPVLVGRNLLTGNALVDVSQSYVAEDKK